MPKPAITRVPNLAITPVSTNKNNGLYAPQLTTIQRDAIPANTLANGAIIYNTTLNSYQIYQNQAWGGIATGIQNGPNSTVGVAILAAGTVVVDTTYVTANSNIFLQTQGTIGAGNSGNVRVSAVVPGTSFTITSTNNADTSLVRWFIVNS